MDRERVNPKSVFEFRIPNADVTTYALCITFPGEDMECPNHVSKLPLALSFKGVEYRYLWQSNILMAHLLEWRRL